MTLRMFSSSAFTAFGISGGSSPRRRSFISELIRSAMRVAASGLTTSCPEQKGHLTKLNTFNPQYGKVCGETPDTGLVFSLTDDGIDLCTVGYGIESGFHSFSSALASDCGGSAPLFPARSACPFGQMHQFLRPVGTPAGVRAPLVSITPQLPHSVQWSFT